MTEHIFEDPQKLVFIQSRAETNFELVDEYAEMMRQGIEFDAVQGIRDDSGQVFIWDGLHRGEAAKLVGELLLVAVKPGTRQDAEWLALSANQKHGLRRTHKDKRRIVRNALLHPYGIKLSDREVARHCGVDHKTVGKIRQELELSGEIPQIEKRIVSRNGATYEQDTRNIGDQSDYVPVWKLEQGVNAWLAATAHPRVTPPNILAEIRAKTEVGEQFLTEMNGFLPVTCRRSDLIEACHNLLGHPRASQESCFSNRQRPEAYSAGHQDRVVTLTPEYVTYETEKSGYEAQAQEFECPRCGQEKIVGVNGSRRWCLNCGAEWPTAAAFLAEVEVLPGQEKRQLRLEDLTRRFTNLLAGVDDQELDRVETWLDDLERSLAPTEEVSPCYAV